jgi:hypothetical protein
MVDAWFTTHRVRKVATDGTVITLATVGGGGGWFLSGVAAALVIGVWALRRRRRRQARPASR